MIACRRFAMVVAMLCVGMGTRGIAQGRGAAAPPPPPCPDATDTRDLLDYYVGIAYRAHASDPSHRLPAPCLVIAIAKSPAAYPDSTITRTLVLTEGLLKGQPDDPSLLNAHLALLYRLRRYGDARAAFDALATNDSSRITAYAYRIAIGSARRDADTAAMLRYLAAATGQFPTAAQFSAEYGILRQVRRLRAAIDTVHRAMKTDPRRTGGYASLASIYGNLEQPDSAFVYIRKGLAAHAPRQEMAAALRSLVGALLRHAQIVDAPDVWETTLPLAFAADSVLSTPDTKYLVALAISRVVYFRIDTLNFYLPDVPLGADRGGFQSIDVTRIPQSSADAECPSIAIVLRLVATAKERLASGGSQSAPETVTAMISGLNAVAARVTPLQRGCTGGREIRGGSIPHELAITVRDQLVLPLYAPIVQVSEHLDHTQAYGEVRHLALRAAWRADASTTLAGRSVLLVDDILTTGTTLSTAAEMLLETGLARVYALVLAHTERSR